MLAPIVVSFFFCLFNKEPLIGRSIGPQKVCAISVSSLYQCQLAHMLLWLGASLVLNISIYFTLSGFTLKELQLETRRGYQKLKRNGFQLLAHLPVRRNCNRRQSEFRQKRHEKKNSLKDAFTVFFVFNTTLGDGFRWRKHAIEEKTKWFHRRRKNCSMVWPLDSFIFFTRCLRGWNWNGLQDL